MTKTELIAICDHTNLSPTATFEDIKALIDEAEKFGAASVCIPPCYVKAAKDYSEGRVKICTVIGFPLGYNSISVKVFEARDAILCGADEIDMVINVGEVKRGNYDYVKEEISAVKDACGENILKVIVEACLLSEEEKIQMCRAVTDGGADFIKTSTGFGKGGATFADVELFKKYVGEGVKIKAAGGIGSFEDAEKFAALGADRLGTSRLIKLMKD